MNAERDREKAGRKKKKLLRANEAGNDHARLPNLVLIVVDRKVPYLQVGARLLDRGEKFDQGLARDHVILGPVYLNLEGMLGE